MKSATTNYTCPTCGTTYAEDLSIICCNAWYDRSAPWDTYEE